MLLNRDLQKRPEVLRDSSPETNTGPYLIYEKFEFGIFHCPCSLLGVSDGRAISDEYRTQTVRFRSYWLPVLLTLLNWSTMVLVLRSSHIDEAGILQASKQIPALLLYISQIL